MDVFVARVERHEPTTHSDRVADWSARAVGSFTFVIGFLAANVVYVVLHIESFPYQFLTLLLSLLAIVMTSLVLIAQNRQAAKDRIRDERDDVQIGHIYTMQSEQMISHARQREQLEALLSAVARS